MSIEWCYVVVRTVRKSRLRWWKVLVLMLVLVAVAVLCVVIKRSRDPPRPTRIGRYPFVLTSNT